MGTYNKTAARSAYLRDRPNRISKAKLNALRKRGGVDSATVEYVHVLTHDPCVYCGRMTVPGPIRADGASIDHIEPTGSSHWTNLTSSCGACNASKGDLRLLPSMLERQLRKDLAPIAEQIWTIKGRTGQRRRIEF